jgi:hypothetical protein
MTDTATCLSTQQSLTESIPETVPELQQLVRQQASEIERLNHRLLRLLNVQSNETSVEVNE